MTRASLVACGCRRRIRGWGRVHRPRGALNPQACRGTSHVKVGVPKEMKPGERRVALVPDAVKKLEDEGFDVVVERGAGERGEPHRRRLRGGGRDARHRHRRLGRRRGAEGRRRPSPPSSAAQGSGPDRLPLAAHEPRPGEAARRGAASRASRWRRSRARPARSRWTRCPRRRSWPATGRRSPARRTLGKFFPMLITAAGTARPVARAGARRRRRRPAGDRDREAARAPSSRHTTCGPP